MDHPYSFSGGKSPATCDRIVALEGEVGEYILLARPGGARPNVFFQKKSSSRLQNKNIFV
jgi:hypothetical protein